MAKPPFELNEEQLEALRRLQAQRQVSRAKSKLMDLAALEANRTGQITDQQRRELISRASNFGIIGVILWLNSHGSGCSRHRTLSCQEPGYRRRSAFRNVD